MLRACADPRCHPNMVATLIWLSGHALILVATEVLRRHGVLNECKVSTDTLASFLALIESRYGSNPYHNSVHALDVALNTNYFCRQSVISDLITPLDRLAAIVAAAVHDFQHPGVSNAFLQATKHEIISGVHAKERKLGRIQDIASRVRRNTNNRRRHCGCRRTFVSFAPARVPGAEGLCL